MKIKICGMNNIDNISAIAALEPDYLGFIFYPHSKRYVGNDFNLDTVAESVKKIKKVGVFVNDTLGAISEKIKKYNLDYVQLHGDETPAFCESIKTLNVNVIKAFQLDSNFQFSYLKNYSHACDYFLFDSKSVHYGGSGVAFDWTILKKYQLNIPFFLSGGIGLDNINDVLKINHNQFYAVDLNSKLETQPGIKSEMDCQKIIELIKNAKYA